MALRELGYIAGQNIIIEYRYAEGKWDQFPELAADLVRLKVDIILVPGGFDQIQAAKNATKTIPIVMVGEGIDPVKANLVESLARPGGATSPDLRTFPENSAVSGWSCSTKPFLNLPVSRFSTNQALRALYSRWKRFSQSRRVRWG